MQIYKLKQNDTENNALDVNLPFGQVFVHFTWLAAATRAPCINCTPAQTWKAAHRSTIGLLSTFRPRLTIAGKKKGAVVHSLLSKTMPCDIAPQQRLCFGSLE